MSTGHKYLQSDDCTVQYMHDAINQAKEAMVNNEVPVGAVIVLEGEVIAYGQNRSINDNDPTAHAEMVALRQAASKIGNYRLVNTEIYVTLEPCAMCFSAMIHARVKRLIYGAGDPKSGVCGGAADIVRFNIFNHQIKITSGVLAEDCGKLLNEFFKHRR